MGAPGMVPKGRNSSVMNTAAVAVNRPREQPSPDLSSALAAVGSSPRKGADVEKIVEGFDALPVLREAFGGRLKWHVALLDGTTVTEAATPPPPPPPVEFQGKRYTPVFQVSDGAWSGANGLRKESVMFAVNEAPPFVVCAFVANEPNTAQAAVLMQLGLLSLRRLLDAELVVRFVRRRRSVGFSPGAEFLQMLSRINAFPLASFPEKDPVGMKLARMAGRRARDDSFTCFRSELDFAEWVLSGEWHQISDLSGDSPLCAQLRSEAMRLCTDAVALKSQSAIADSEFLKALKNSMELEGTSRGRRRGWAAAALGLEQQP